MGELTKLGRYQLKKVLGRGAMGVVYEGLDPSLNRRVAVKTILKNAAIDEETAQMYSAQFEREAQAAGRLNHPNIVQVHDFGQEGDVAYLVMEYIQGRELRSYFEAKEKFDVAEAVRIMGELLDALALAHEAGVIHRDIKPANIMLDAQRRVKLADFGVARIQDSERSAAGTMVGTPAFMSPEQISGGKIDKRTDLFSAGTILYQLLTGDQPFTGVGAWTVAKKIMQDDPPQPSSVVKSVSPVFDGIVNKALAKKSADRYASAKEFAEALRGALGPQPSATATTPPIAALRPRTGAPAASPASEAEVEFWKAIQNSTDAAEFEFYLEQFPEGTYSGLARHKIARLNAPIEAAKAAADRAAAEQAALEKAAAEKAAAEKAALQRAAAEKAAAESARQEAERQAAAARAKAEAEERARREAAEKVQREAVEKAEREAQERARKEAETRARKEAETRERVEAELKAREAQRQAEEKTRKEAQERARQAAALAKLKEQEAARSEADPEATIAITRTAAKLRAPSPAQAPAATALQPPKKSFVLPAAIGALVVAAGVAAFFMKGKPEPAPVVQAPAPAAPVTATAPAAPVAAPAAPVVDEAKIRREVEERVRREYADKSAAEQAKVAAAATAKAVQEKQAAAKAVNEKASADKAAAEKVAAEKAQADKLAAARAAGEKAAAEKAHADAERAAAEKAVAEKAAAEKAGSEKAAADRLAADLAAASKNAGPSQQELVDRFAQRKGRGKVVTQDPPFAAGALMQGEVVYVNNGSCGYGRIREVVGGNMQRNMPRSFRCISLND